MSDMSVSLKNVSGLWDNYSYIEKETKCQYISSKGSKAMATKPAGATQQGSGGPRTSRPRLKLKDMRLRCQRQFAEVSIRIHKLARPGSDPSMRTGGLALIASSQRLLIHTTPFGGAWSSQSGEIAQSLGSPDQQ
jgi:hypothetical protein